MRPMIAGERGWLLAVVVLLLSGGLGTILTAAENVSMTSPGASFDAAPFGFVMDDEPSAYGVRWAEPRKIRRLIVEFGAGAAPSADKVRVQYWHASWDAKPEPVASEKGAGGVGWEQMDDWTNGAWKDADTKLQIQGRKWVFTFAPTGAKEFPASAPGVCYRKTLKIRLMADGPLPRPSRFEALTDSVYQPLIVRIHFGTPAHPRLQLGAVETGQLEVFNGSVSALRPINRGEITGRRWSLPAGEEAGLEAEILMTADRLNPGFDATVVTVRSHQRPFSFAADQAARGERILVDDLGVLVVRGDDPSTLESLRRDRRELAGQTVYSRVFKKPEQTLSHAWDAMPLKRPLYFVHGLPGDRNAMHQQPGGDLVITANKHWFNVQPSPKDTARKLWGGEFLNLGFGLPNSYDINRRALQDGYLPALTTWYRDGALAYEQTCVLDALDGNLERVDLDTPSVLLMHVRVVNTSGTQSGTARLLLSSRADAPEKLSIQDTRVMAEWSGKLRLRYVLKGGDRSQIQPEGNALAWSRVLAPGEACDVYCFVPSITLDKDDEIAALAARDFEADALRVCKYWHDQVMRGCQITTPEPWLNDFHKAHLQHMLVNCYKQIGSDHLHAHVGTFGYGVYPDESVMMISDLDRRGYHDEARRCYQSFLDYQGTCAMPGNFKSKVGTLYGSGGHETGGYNKSHGWAMWGLAEHWWVTRDRQWMEASAPKLIAACDWVVRERGATMLTAKDGSKPLDYGFLPTGSLEDVTDYWSWLVTNACTDWGFQALSAALADYGHPEAPRLRKEAQAFHADLMRGFEESRILAPVVRLRDGTYVPKYPSRLYERGRTHGWLRETLEGAIHLLITDLIDAQSPPADWILKDFEDNLYISDEYGYAIPVFDVFWFSRGGFSMQANLLGGPLPYLYRDEVKHFLRAYFNSFASAFYPDTRMFNEHSLPELGYPAGDHFKTSDEAQSTYWLRLMFVNERGGDLYLGQAIPRYWLASGKTVGIERAATHYGPLSMQITSESAGGQIKVKLVRSPFPAQPGKIYLRVRHPEEKPIRDVLVNGQPHTQYDVAKEWVILPGTTAGQTEVIVRY